MVLAHTNVVTASAQSVDHAVTVWQILARERDGGVTEDG
jgi:hypothetical protein